MQLPYDLETPFPGIYSREIKTYIHKKRVHNARNNMNLTLEINKNNSVATETTNYPQHEEE